MQMAATATSSGELQVRQILRDGALVAVLMAIDQGDTYTVVAEVFSSSGDDAANATAVNRRPYVFPDSDSAHAFLTEAVTSFTYLGCEIREL